VTPRRSTPALRREVAALLRHFASHPARTITYADVAEQLSRVLTRTHPSDAAIAAGSEDA